MMRSGGGSLLDGVRPLLLELALHKMLEKTQRLLKGTTLTKYRFTNLKVLKYVDEEH